MSFVDPEIIDQAGVSLRKSLETLNSCIDKMTESVKTDLGKDPEPEYDRDMVVHLAWLTHQVIQIVAELKILEAGPGTGKKSGSLSDRFKK